MKSCLDSLKQMRVDELKEIEKNLDMNHPTNIQKEKRAELILQDYIEKLMSCYIFLNRLV